MSFRRLPRLIAEDPAINQVIGRASHVLAVPDPARAAVLAGLVQASERRPVLVATPTTAEADRLTHDLGVYLGPDRVAAFPAWETLPFERVSPGFEVMGVRMRTLARLADDADNLDVVVAPVRALIQLLGPDATAVRPIVVGVDDSLDPERLVADLVGVGYRREPQVEHRGEVAWRGSIVDVFPSTSDVPFRIDLWGDTVDRLTEFSVATQRSEVDRAEIEIYPCRELLPTPEVRERAEELIATEPWGREQWQRLADGELFDGMESWLPWLIDREVLLPDLFDDDSLVVLVEPTRMRDRAADLRAEESDLADTLAVTWEAADDDGHHEFPRLHLGFDRLLAASEAPAISVAALPEGPDTAQVIASGWDTPGDALAERLRRVTFDGGRLIVAADGAGTAARLADILREAELAPEVHDTIPDHFGPGVHVVVQPIERGFLLPELGVGVITEAELTGRRRAHRRAKPKRRQTEGFFDDLKAGDYVVHHQHGVGRFAGMVRRRIGGVERDYLQIDYRGDEKLYIPSEGIDLIRRYTGGESPTINRLGGSDFARTKAKVRSAVQEIAQNLVVLYQKRIAAEGRAYGADTPWQTEMEAAFPYELTPDQASAIVDVKDDMEATRPMDRLVVGDVGFGKTEVAIRAAFKAVQDGCQVAILVPTTLLAQQHHSTIAERFAPYPIRVEVLSRFLTAAEARAVVEATKAGEVDVLIGTHRLLSADVEFPKLGLLVVDEEQRFGVNAKEAIKELQAGVDVLTLSATPIPRTLEMSLVGIRDLSVLNTPPADRQPILTYVGEYDERAAAEALRRELLREGQVFFIHNRVQDIDKVADELRDLVPEARIAVAHGQMDEGSLEQIVLDFWDGSYDVLVSTTIVESGIDMPTVNTLVVDRAELLGLGQLHQLRGRVGRSGQRAYAYLFTRPDAQLSEEAYERLRTIGEATDLGAGFQIAMRDLEIRGAGNLLGTGQSGHIAAVGYDLYCQLVTEAVAELKGEAIPQPVDVKLELPVEANLSEDYVVNPAHRLEAYRKLANVTSEPMVNDLESEWRDRFGPPPPAAERLLAVARLRAECVRLGVREVIAVKGPGFGGPEFIARVGPVQLPASKEMRFNRLFKDGKWKPNEYGEEGGQLQVPLKRKGSLAEDLALFFAEMFPAED